MIFLYIHSYNGGDIEMANYLMDGFANLVLSPFINLLSRPMPFHRQRQANRLQKTQYIIGLVNVS